MPDMPMFPLGTVLMPGMGLPLQVFEPRYRALMDHCMAGDREFGVTLIERGSEVGGGDVRSMAGTIASIAEAQQLPDGRWRLLAVGTRRIRVVRWLDDDPYPRAEVEDWPDHEVDPSTADGAAEELERRVGHYRRVMALAAELGHPAQPLAEVSDQLVEGSYQLSMLSPLGPLDRQHLLTAPGPVERLQLLGELLDDVEVELRARLAGG
jgi:Lon protease-like protein